MYLMYQKPISCVFKIDARRIIIIVYSVQRYILKFLNFICF